jgi:hypothetical protein
MGTTPKLSFATSWINTFTDPCKTAGGLDQLDNCNVIAEGFGQVMEWAGHKWEIKHKQNEATPADWVYKGARARPDDKLCTAKGDDARKGHGVDTVDFAIVVTHGARGFDVVGKRTLKFAKVYFNVKPCRFCGHKTRLGDGKLKWLVIDACHCLDIDKSDGYTPWSMWKDSFYGLHTIFGFTGNTTDSWWVNDRGSAFALEIIADSELAEAWIDSSYSHFCKDRPSVATAGRNFQDAYNRMRSERVSSSFDSIPHKEVIFIASVTRR